jgi:hypothetical protein
VRSLRLFGLELAPARSGTAPARNLPPGRRAPPQSRRRRALSLRSTLDVRKMVQLAGGRPPMPAGAVRRTL